MHNALGMQLTDGKDNLSCIEFENILWESTLFLEDFIELTSVDERHYKVQSDLTLEKVVHSGKEWMISCEEDVLLKECTCDLVIFNENILSNSFDGEELSC